MKQASGSHFTRLCSKSTFKSFPINIDFEICRFSCPATLLLRSGSHKWLLWRQSTRRPSFTLYLRHLLTFQNLHTGIRKYYSRESEINTFAKIQKCFIN